MKTILSLAKQFVFWMLVFILARTIFYIYYSNILNLENIPLSEVFQSFWHAIPLDISTAGYILVIPFFILLFQSLIYENTLKKVNLFYTIIILLLYLLITTAEIGIYDEWKTKLQFKSLHYLSHPDEIYNSSSSSTFFLLIGIFIAQFTFWIYIYRKLIYNSIIVTNKSLLSTFVYFIISPVLLFLMIRGGISEIPITQSKSYFSSHNFINLASVNSGYSMLISTIENYQFRDNNPYQFYNDSIALERVTNLNAVKNDTTISILTTNRPNIVFLILESWSADLIESLGATPGITPEFRNLEKEGLLFTNFYASGNRSEQAMSAIFAGFPATPITAITHNLDKITKLPSFTKSLEEKGYNTSYYFGGQLMYGGINSFISVNGFDVIKEGKDFDSDIPRGKLGIHDGDMADFWINDLNNYPQPFMSAWFTLSSHSPYDQPMEDVIHWAESENQNGYLNSAYYCDKSIGEFFAKAKQQPWYSNTLFVIVADHSHNSYKNHPVHTKEYRHIPLLLYGDVLKPEYRGATINRISSQTDIPATLLNQMGISSNEFYWSRNLFNPTTPEFAFYECTAGVGWISEGGYFVWDSRLSNLAVKDIDAAKPDSIITDGKSYLQVLFKQFMDY